MRKVFYFLAIAVLSISSQAAHGCDLASGTFPVDQVPPTVTFEGLHNYSRIFLQVPLSVRASDSVGVSRVELHIDQVLFATNNVSPTLTDVLVNFNLETIARGQHNLQARAYDAAGNVQTATLVIFSSSLTSPTGDTIVLVPSIKYQKMQGWEATAQAAQFSPAFNNYKNALFDQAVSDLGLDRIRLEVVSGIENPTDYFSQMLAGKITYSAYNSKRYEINNDNSNPNSINDSGFKWASMDYSIDNVVLPLRQRLQARGERLWINANYIDFGSSAFEHKNTPAEYAEFVLAAYQHMQSRYGFVPDSWEVILEPDTGTASWSAVQVAEAIKAAGDRLTANGFTPNFVAPSVTYIGNAPNYINQIAKTSGAMRYVSEFAYHRYGGATEAQLQAVADLANQHIKKTSMLELIGADHLTLHQDLKLGQVSSWQQYTLAFIDEGSGDNGAQYYIINDANPNQPMITTANRTKYLRQYFRYIRTGAQRIEAQTGNSAFDPVAFINSDGKYVVVVKATNGGSFSIQNLPAGIYGIKYTTEASYNVDLSDVPLGAGQSLTASIPNPGVITIFAR